MCFSSIIYLDENFAHLVIEMKFATLGCNNLNNLSIHTSVFAGVLKQLTHFTLTIMSCLQNVLYQFQMFNRQYIWEKLKTVFKI